MITKKVNVENMVCDIGVSHTDQGTQLIIPPCLTGKDYGLSVLFDKTSDYYAALEKSDFSKCDNVKETMIYFYWDTEQNDEDLKMEALQALVIRHKSKIKNLTADDIAYLKKCVIKSYKLRCL